MKHFIVFVLLIFTVIQCAFFPTDVTYSRERISAYITDFELVAPFHFGNEFYRVGGAKFRVAGESGVIFDVQYKVYGKVWFCGDGRQDAIDITSDMVSIADTLHISNNTIYLGVGTDFLTVLIDKNAPRPGQQQYAGTVGVSIYYKNDDGENHVSKSESYDYSNLYCQ